MCQAQNRVWFSKGCPSKIGILAVVILGLYIIAYSPGMGTVPWVLNSEIYPLRSRGLGGGIATVSNFVPETKGLQFEEVGSVMSFVGGGEGGAHDWIS